MIERADQLHHNNVPAHFTALMHASFGRASHHPGLSEYLQPRFGLLRLLAFPKANIAVEMEEICFCCIIHYSHRVVKYKVGNFKI
jgi:hypothetical protein